MAVHALSGDHIHSLCETTQASQECVSDADKRDGKAMSPAERRNDTKKALLARCRRRCTTTKSPGRSLSRAGIMWSKASTKRKQHRHFGAGALHNTALRIMCKLQKNVQG